MNEGKDIPESVSVIDFAGQSYAVPTSIAAAFLQTCQAVAPARAGVQVVYYTTEFDYNRFSIRPCLVVDEKDDHIKRFHGNPLGIPPVPEPKQTELDLEDKPDDQIHDASEPRGPATSDVGDTGQ